MSAVTDRFAAMSAAEVRGFFRDSDVLDITTMIRDASDDDLRTLIGIEVFREEGVVAILDRFAEFAHADRLAAITGVVRFELTRSRKEIERHTARFASGTVTLDDDATPHVTICADIVDFVRLVTGQRNAALLYLGGELCIEGDEMLALEVGTVFTVPGSGHVAVDPSALDPVDVATAVASSSGRHMRAVMEGGFRPIVLEEVFRRFPEFIDARKAAGPRAHGRVPDRGSQGRRGRPLRRARRRRRRAPWTRVLRRASGETRRSSWTAPTSSGSSPDSCTRSAGC